MSEEKKAEFRCSECTTPCDSSVGYDDRDQTHNAPDGCLFLATSDKADWKRVEQEQPETIKQESQHRSYLPEFMEFCKKNALDFSGSDGKLVYIAAGADRFSVEPDLSQHFGDIPLDSKRAYLLLQLCDAVNEKT